MNQKTAFIELSGVAGKCGGHDVFLGFAPARKLHIISFADVLNEDTGLGYQRPRDIAHSLDFKRYILRPESSTIPLTFNLRKELSKYWSLSSRNGAAVLRVKKGCFCLAQVDCQHRLGELGDQDIPLAFMAFVGLDLQTEMAMFTIINSKAKGLSSSLTDYHRSNLVVNLAENVPELYLARRLNEEFRSPWRGLIKYGGSSTSGLKRRTSLRMMQKAIKRVLVRTHCINIIGVEETFEMLLGYWNAVSKVFAKDWANNRSTLITKGVGLYALSQLLVVILKNMENRKYDETFFIHILKPLESQVDWGTHGVFSDAGGQKGAAAVFSTLEGILAL